MFQQTALTVVEPAVDPKDVESVNTLLGMLSYKRPAGSKSERNFIRAYLKPLGLSTDSMGNLYKKIGKSQVLWSAHTDSVHHVGGNQKLAYDEGKIFLPKETISNCLGADNAAGCWLLREMILAKVPGTYIFHRSEEIGGLGSRFIAKNMTDDEGLKAAIAFDRRGTRSIITHQGWQRTCSDEFADCLAGLMNMDMIKDDGGFFTDTANYVNVIGECTNISVGTENEHMRSESLDIKHLFRLRDVMVEFDESKLEYTRNPGDYEAKEHSWHSNYYGGSWGKTAWGGTSALGGEGKYQRSSDGKGYYYYNNLSKKQREERKKEFEEVFKDVRTEEKVKYRSDYTMLELVRDNPAEVADYLEHIGLDTYDILNYLENVKTATKIREFDV